MQKVIVFLRSFRFRLTLWYVGVLALVMLVLGAVIYVALSNSLRSGQDDLLKARAGQVAASYNISDGQLNLQEQDENTPVLPAEGEILLLLNNRGQVVQKAGRMSSNDIVGLVGLAARTRAGQPQNYVDNFLLAPAARSVTDRGYLLNYRVYISPVVDNGQVLATLVLGRSQASTEAIAHNLLLVFLITAPMALLTSALGGYWLASRAMRPVRAISQTARQMSESDLSRRFEIRRKDELGELATTFNQLFSRLENAFNRQRQFSADASHELRTPLSIISLEIEQALSGLLTKDQYHEALTNIRLETEQMTRLVNDLLTLARADVGKNQLKREELDIGEIMLEVVERLTPLARSQGVTLVVGSGGQIMSELPVTGDYLYLSQLLTNLVENAIKYSAVRENPSGVISASLPSNVLSNNSASVSNSVTPMGLALPEQTGNLTSEAQLVEAVLPYPNSKWVRLEAERDSPWVVVRVRDNGPGIDQAHRPFLFERFYRADLARSNNNLNNLSSEQHYPTRESELPGGNGLGLAIVKWIVEAHNGQIKLESTTEAEAVDGKHGTCFEIRLPVAEN